MQQSTKSKKYLCYLRVGVGGWKCSCCAPPRGKRSQMFRSAKRKDKRKALAEQLAEYHNT